MPSATLASSVDSSEPCHVLLFGDLTTDFEDDLFQLLHRKSNATLESFFDQVNMAFRQEFSLLSTEEQGWLPQFTDLVDLAANMDDAVSAQALRSSLLCVYQLGRFINSDIYPDATSSYLIGVCTGSFAATAISSSRTMTELVPAAVEAVLVAFRTGLHSLKMQRHIEPWSGEGSRSWSYILSLPECKAQEIVRQFNSEARIPRSSQPYCLLVVIAYWIYNLIFHPLRRFPGPKLWAASRLPWCYYQYRGQLHHRLLQLHIEYGHTVPVAPNELSYTHEEAWKTIYGYRKEEMAKDPIFRLHTPTGAQNILVADRGTHTRQRRLLAHAFSESALREQEPILQLYANKLLDQLSRECHKGPVDMVAWLTFASFDLIGHMSFGENFGCLDKGDYHPFVRAIAAMASELTFTQMWKYWGLMSIRALFTPKAVRGQRAKHIKKAMQTVQTRIEKGSEHRDFLHYILSANDDNKGMSPDEINVNAFSLSIAGSESTATALSGAVFLLLTHPSVYERVLTETRSAHPTEADITLSSTHHLEYLNAVITETLRIYPPVAITPPRRVPAGGDIILDRFAPAGVTVGVHHYAATHHPDNFHRPNDFLPHRWMSGTRDRPPFVPDRRECMQPFSFGPRNCLGKNMARAEMRLLLAKLQYRFDWRELRTGQEEWMYG